LFIDCGVHRQGLELQHAARWLRDYETRFVAYEAGAAQYGEAVKNLSHISNLDLRHAAVVGPEQNETTVSLHLAASGGLGDSLFAQRGASSGQAMEDVTAAHVSDEIASASEDVVILRMNIEGAEMFVIQDLIAANCLKRVSGFYGRWDDLSKIDPLRDLQFRDLLREHGVRFFTFNGRDLSHLLRRAAIRYDLATSIRRQHR
jgi:FkbM family methyltransferase